MNINNSEDHFLNRSIALLTPEGIKKLATSKIAVAGCGGIGGAMAITLCRMGITHFHLADPADFDAPDMNRQWGATLNSMGRNKAQVYRDMILDINPDATVTTFTDGLTMQNQHEFLAGADVLIDCLDVSVAYELRETMHAIAHKSAMFSAVAPILGFGCFAICSSPNGMSMEYWTKIIKDSKQANAVPEFFYENFVPEQLDVIGENLQLGKVPTVSVGPLIGSALLATECIAYLLDGVIPGSRKPIVLPNVMAFDLLKMNYRIIDINKSQKTTGDEAA